MTDRVDYNRRYYLAHRDEQLAAKKRNYTNPEFKRLSRERDKRRYEHNAAWGGLLRIDPKLFL